MSKRDAIWLVWLASLGPAHVLLGQWETPDVYKLIFVDDSAVGLNNGQGWEDAFTDLQLALDAAATHEGHDYGIDIRVAEGTYRPSKRTDPDDPRSATFQLPPGVRLFGGYEGSSNSNNVRDWQAYPSILSGDLLANDDEFSPMVDDNAYHVVSRDRTNGLVLVDGFVIRDGNADREFDSQGGGLYSRGIINICHCLFTKNLAGKVRIADGGVATFAEGGGALAILISNEEATRPLILVSSCRFVENIGASVGGGVNLYGRSTNFQVENCHFQDNQAGLGGAIFLAGVEAAFEIDGSTFYRNYGFEGGGAVDGSNFRIDLSVCNSFFHENEGYAGGGIRSSNKNIELYGSTFEHNKAEWQGGGAWIAGDQQTMVKDCVFRGNGSSSGGGLAVSNGKVAHCEFDNNTATYGGGATGNNTDFQDCSFLANIAHSVGGGLHAADYPESGSLSDCYFAVNRAGFGGGAYMRGYIENYSVDRCTFVYNDASIGGGAYVIDSPVVVEFRNSLFGGNHADYGAGLAGGAPGFSSNFSLTGCTVVLNNATTLGGGLSGGGDAEIRNSILWRNFAGEQFPPSQEYQADELGAMHLNYSIVEGWTGEFGGTGNSASDPLFVSLFSDFRLLPQSPARNSGDPAFTALASEADLDRHDRVLCGRVDMGAYESGIGDADCDRVVDLSDFAALVECAEGVDEIEVCRQVDFDHDGDFDLRDFAAMQQALAEGQ